MSAQGSSRVMIDAHAHVISPDTERYPPRADAGPEVGALVRDAFSAERLLESIQRYPVRGALLVQRGQVYANDNSYVCDAAVQYPQWFRAVCGVDGRASECAKVARSWIERGAVGLRLMQPDRSEDVSWLAGPSAEGLWRICAERHVPLCVHFFPWNRVRGLAVLNEMMTHHPHASVVVEHLSNAAIDGSGNLLVDEGLKRLADQPRAVLKLTTIPLGRMLREQIAVEPMLRTCGALFGFDRLIWGSDISQSAGTYEEMVSFGRRAVASLSAAQQEAVLSANAERIYRLTFAK